MESGFFGTSSPYLESLIADFFAFLVPDDLGLRVAGGLAHKGGHAPLDSCLVLRRSCEPRGCCVGRETENVTLFLRLCCASLTSVLLGSHGHFTNKHSHARVRVL